jgi:uncharacterized protein (DUF362 family)
MANKIDRRSFIKGSATIGVSSFLFGRAMKSGRTFAQEKPAVEREDRISIAQGDDYYTNTVKAVELFGGIGRFVPKGAKVALLPNAQRNNPGTFTKPEIVRAVIRMCRDAGASEVKVISCLQLDRWKAAGLEQAIIAAGGKLVLTDLRDETQFKTVPIPKGIALKEAKIMAEYFKYDVFINLPITKDHLGNRFTGTLKNMMGLNFYQSNRTFHTGLFESKPDDVNHLDQCIADLNTVIKPHLCIVDATEFITTNGPFGPGEIIKPKKVICGTDRVAIDSYCCTLWGLKPQEIIMIKKANEHGLGEMDLAKVKLIEPAA